MGSLRCLELCDGAAAEVVRRVQEAMEEALGRPVKMTLIPLGKFKALISPAALNTSWMDLGKSSPFQQGHCNCLGCRLLREQLAAMAERN